MFSLRPFAATDADYESLASVIRAAKPEYPKSVAELRDDDATYAVIDKPWGRLFAVDDSGTAVGFAEFAPALFQPGDGKYYLFLLVTPEYHGRGIGKMLYDALREEMHPYDPTYIKIEWREDMARAVRFFIERGFKEVSRYYESRLDIATFDFALFPNEFDSPLSFGLRILSWRELKATDPDADRKMWAAAMEMAVDVPSDEPFEPIEFDTFQTVVMQRPNLDPDGFFVAVDTATGDYAGISHVWRRQADNDLDTGLTAVKRDYRRKGIALALKLRILRWAQTNGFHFLRTGNEINNRPMLAINERLGFVKQPPWIEFVWRV